MNAKEIIKEAYDNDVEILKQAFESDKKLYLNFMAYISKLTSILVCKGIIGEDEILKILNDESIEKRFNEALEKGDK